MTLELNKEQTKAVNSTEGNLLILASAGTGKTTTIVERYINLIKNHNINPDDIMITTFTNKAANDMVKKISKRTDKTPKYLGTMHSLFLNIFRNNAKKIDLYSNFTLLTEENDKKRIIKEILVKREVEPTSKGVLYLLKRIGMFKNRGINHEELVENPDLYEDNNEKEEIEAGE